MSTIKVDTYLTRGGVSEIAIDKLKGASSAGSMTVVGEGGTTTTNLQQGLAKFWCNFVGLSTVNLRDNLNVSSLTDIGTGQYDITITNGFASTEYSPGQTTDNFARYSSIQSTTVFRHISLNNSFAVSDAGVITSQGWGDLA